MEHYTRNTVSVSAYCSKCGKKTLHRVDDVKLGPCLECIVRSEAARAGVPVKVQNGELMVQCTDATLDYLLKRCAGANTEQAIPVLCTCFQREYPHELSIHAEIKREAYNPAVRYSWPWSLTLSNRVEPSTVKSNV